MKYILLICTLSVCATDHLNTLKNISTSTLFKKTIALSREDLHDSTPSTASQSTQENEQPSTIIKPNVEELFDVSLIDHTSTASTLSMEELTDNEGPDQKKSVVIKKTKRCRFCSCVGYALVCGCLRPKSDG